MSNNKHKIQLTPEEKKARLKNRKLNNNLVLLTLLLSVLVIAFFVFNIGTIGLKKTNTSTGETLQLDIKNKLTNDQYVIGNNPTNVQKEYFEELTNILNSIETDEDKMNVSQAVVKCFVADYYTWTNKDGNYEVGGVQYIYGPKYIMFQEESRYKFYCDLDLYISQYGRENLLEVVNVDIPTVDYASDYVVNGEVYESFYVEAKWQYKESSKIDVSEFQNKAYFIVINNNGRFEIAKIQPMDW